MTVSFVAEHSLPLSITPQLMKFGQEFSRDIKATKDLTMQRTTASYKLKEGLSEVIRKRLVADLQSHKFSMNMDECTSTSNKKVLSVLVSYFSDELNKCIVHHYLSTSLTVVKATIIHSVIFDSLKKDNIPLDNLISNLSDSAGFETLLRSSAPHLLDIDGDTCHHIHNSVRKFCSHFQSHVEGLCDDLFQDTRFSPDIKSYLEQLCRFVGTHYLTPLERIAHRWLSIFDVSKRILSMIGPITLLYSAWIPADLKDAYTVHTDPLMQGLLKEEVKKVRHIQACFSAKNVTPAGKNRKLRVVEKVFYHRSKTLLMMSMYQSVLPLFKSFILMFELKEPMMHRLHDEQTDLFRHFLACFLKQENLKDVSAAHLKKIDVVNQNLHLPPNDIFIGDAAENLLKSLKKHSTLRQEFRKMIISAYTNAASYMQAKLPLCNQLLICLSAIDPKAQGHSVTHKHLKKLVKFFPTVIKSGPEMDEYLKDASRIQVDASLPETDIVSAGQPSKRKQLDHWWAEVMPQYPTLGKVVKACLSIFTGPQIEQSFSVMNDIIDKKSNRLDIKTYSAMQAVKYDLKARKTSTLQHCHREDIHHDPVDKSLIFHMQTAYGRYYRKLQVEKEKKAEESKKGEGPRKSTPKLTVHQLAQKMKKKIMKKGKVDKKRKLSVSDTSQKYKKLKV